MKRTLSALAVLCAANAAMAADPALTIEDPYARASTSMSTSGAAFFVIGNSADVDDRLVAASSPAADRVELHTHIEDANGVMRMVEVEDGIPVPSGGEAALKRGGDHVMFMGLKEPLEHGGVVPLTLVFENAGEMTIDVPVDLERMPDHSHHHGG
ncbi:MAG: copper chaperone PCu(A)C [Pseudomonadota bacterium]